MQRLEVSGAVRPIYGSLGVRRLRTEGKAIFSDTALLQFLVIYLLSQLHPKSRFAELFLSAFAKLRKATVSFVMSVCPSVHPSTSTTRPSTGRIGTKFCILIFFFENLSQRVKFN